MSYPRLLATFGLILLGIGACLCWYIEGTSVEPSAATLPAAQRSAGSARITPGSVGYYGQAPRGSAYRSSGWQSRGAGAARTAARLPYHPIKIAQPAAAAVPTAPAQPGVGTGAAAPSEG
jgi:hypothetical protein